MTTKRIKCLGIDLTREVKGGFVGYCFLLQVRWELWMGLEQRSNTPPIPVLQDPSGWCFESRMQPGESGEVGGQGRKPGNQLGGYCSELTATAPLPLFLPFSLGIRTPGLQPQLHQPLTCCVTLGKSLSLSGSCIL